MLPRPNFAKLRAPRKHMTQALKQLACPQSQIHGWTGLVMDPGLYARIKPDNFTVMASTIGTTYGGATTIPSEISTAINQLAANQLAIQQQMAAMTFADNALAHHTQFQIPPIQNMGQQPFSGAAQGSFNTRLGGDGCQCSGHGHGCTGSRGGGLGRGAFAQQIQGKF